MPAYNGRIAIVGIAESDYGRVPNMTELQLHAQAVQRALEDSGLRKQEIDGVFCSSDTMSMPTVTLCEYVQVFPRYTDSTSIGGASFEAHLNHAVAAIRTGKCEVACISYASNELSSRGRTFGTVNQPVTIPEATYEVPYGNTLVGAYAMAARRHMHQYGTTSEQLAEIAVVTRRHAGLNPLALYRKPITVQDVLDSRMEAGVRPDEMDMAMIYDSFTLTVLLLLEDLGFCKKGEGGAFVQDGRIALGGQLPINTDGGGLSANHPGMRGIFLIIEAARQLRGQCGPRQVKDAKLALAHGSGGLLSSQATTILGR